MSGFVDVQVVECARLSSEEAKTKNNDNFSLWTNNLTDIIHLDAGDKVEVHGAMISERGAGQPDAIEIKGVDLGFQKTYNYINLSGINASSEAASGFEQIDANLSSKTVNIRDDTGLFEMSYYINMNGHNYIQLPRNFWWNDTLNPASKNWGDSDTIGNGGRSLWDPFNGNTIRKQPLDTYQLFEDYYQSSYNGQNCQNNDNGRYTLMVRDKTFFTNTDGYNNYHQFQAPRYQRDPENCVYNKYVEVKELKVNKGFSSPETISAELTKQLQSITKTNILNIKSVKDKADNISTPGFPVPVWKTVETETYKAFDVASINNTAMNNLFNAWINDAYPPEEGAKYLLNYMYVGCKRPELYETGRLVNFIGGEGNNTGILGSALIADINGSSEYIELNSIYTEETVNLWRNFILAQEDYPEIWNIFSDTRTPYDKSSTINNSRWFHMNRLTNASMTLGGGVENAQLGWGGYIEPSWRSNSSEQLSSVIVPFVYDPDQKDKFYESPDDKLNQLSFGCFAQNASGKIKLKITPTNGSGSNLFNMLNVSSKIETGRKCGYDMHFSAPGNDFVLPFSGYSIVPQQFNGAMLNLVENLQARNSNVVVMKDYHLVPYPHRSKLYIGADSPEINWDGANFSINNLHTGLNRGNDLRTGAPGVVNSWGQTADLGGEADEIVYKINPKEQFTDWTPARQPYIAEVSLYINASHIAANQYQGGSLNENLEPWEIYDSLGGIFIEDFKLSEAEWQGSLWERLGFSYQQFHSSKNTRRDRIEPNNIESLSKITTNAEVSEGDIKIYYQNLWGVRMLKNMLPFAQILRQTETNGTLTRKTVQYPEIIVKTQSMSIKAQNLPTRMIRGYYTVRSNIIDQASFIGGKKDNTMMPVVGIVNKINAAGDFYQQQGSDVVFTITKPLRLASIMCSVHDPDGSYANTSEQSTVLFKITKQKNVSLNVVQDLINAQAQQNNGKAPAL